jgi:hypothetical protein
VSDADAARSAKHLGSIDHSLKELVKVMATLNSNFVELVKAFREADIEVIRDFDSHGAVQMTLDVANKEGDGDSIS